LARLLVASEPVVADPMTRIVASGCSVNLEIVDVVWRPLSASFASRDLLMAPRIGMIGVPPCAGEQEEIDESENDEEEPKPHDWGREVLGCVVDRVGPE